MQTNWFIVIHVGEAWWIDNEGKAFGPFPNRERAGAEALEIARVFGDTDRQSRIYWPGDDGRHRLVWSGK